MYNPVDHVLRKTFDFKKSKSHAEKRTYLNVARYGQGEKLTKTQRTVLVKFVNLWCYHRGRSGFITQAIDIIAGKLGYASDTVKKAISFLMKLGIVRRVHGGLGRGNVSSYILDTPTLIEVMSPDLAFKCAGEMVTIEGEIKGVETRRPYIDNKTTLARSGPKGTRGGQWIDLSHLDWLEVQDLFRRFKSRVTSWGAAATARHPSCRLALLDTPGREADVAPARGVCA